MDDTPRQIFHFGVWIFDVTAAQQIIRDHPRATSPIDVAMWARAFGLGQARAVHRAVDRTRSP
jgi:hypothetical protein